MNMYAHIYLKNNNYFLYQLLTVSSVKFLLNTKYVFILKIFAYLDVNIECNIEKGFQGPIICIDYVRLNRKEKRKCTELF